VLLAVIQTPFELQSGFKSEWLLQLHCGDDGVCGLWTEGAQAPVGQQSVMPTNGTPVDFVEVIRLEYSILNL
jgi:hypothetical protein